MSATLPSIIESGLSSSTNNKYHTGWNRWLNWSGRNSEVNKLPANPFFVALFLNYILTEFKTKGALVSAFYGIRWGHTISGFSSPTDHPFVQLAFEGCQRMITSQGKHPKEPISPQILKMLYNKYGQDNNNLFDLRFVVMCFLGFAGFFRIEELLSVQLKNVNFSSTHLEITIEKSKCDQHRDGHIVYVSKLNSEYCPVKVLDRFLCSCKIDRTDENCFIIPRLFKTKTGYNASKNLGISYTTARDIFAKKLKECDLRSELYGLHSLRSGGATAAASNNVDDRLISKHGRWKSDKSKNGYIKDTVEKRLQISKSLGL